MFYAIGINIENKIMFSDYIIILSTQNNAVRQQPRETECCAGEGAEGINQDTTLDEIF